jgi:hypothetical protein
MRTLTILTCVLALAACASPADRQRQSRLFAVDKCEPVRSSGTPAFDRCVEDTMAACAAGRETCK